MESPCRRGPAEGRMAAMHLVTGGSAYPDRYSKIITQSSTMQYVPTFNAIADSDLEPPREHV